MLLIDILDLSQGHNDVTDKIRKYLSGEYSGRKIEKTVKNSVRELGMKSRTIGCYSSDIASNTGITIRVYNRYYQPTQREFERLQTLPDDYTSSIPYKKAVFAIGNGWTVDVIAHIFKGLTDTTGKIIQNAIDKDQIRFF